MQNAAPPTAAPPVRPLVILNASAGSASNAGDLEERVRERFPAAAIVRPSDPEEAVAAVRRRDPAADAIVVGGGDGSISSVLEPLIESGLPLGVLPLGTANDFARSIGVPDLDGAFEAIAAGRTRAVDVGEGNGRLFLNTLAIGLPAAAARELTGELKKRLGMFAAAAVVPRLLRGRPFAVELRDGDGTVRVASCMAVLAGAGRYTGGIPVAYDDLDDGRLHLTICRAQTWWQAISVLASALTRRLKEDWNVIERATVECTLATARPLDVAVDGDIALKTPVELKVRPAALRVFVPAKELLKP